MSMPGTKAFLKKAKDIHEAHKNRGTHKDSSGGGHGGGDAHDESNWLISYADMMTLLCGFFIMLFSMAKLDDTKYEKVKEEVSKTFKGQYSEPPSKEVGKFLSQLINEAGVEKDAVVRADPSGVTVTFQSTVFFDTLSADVRPQGRIVLSRLIEAIASRQQKDHKEYRIVVEGHTDSRPILSGSFPSNWELSGARASRVVRMFSERGFAPTLLTSIGYGDARPVAVSRKPTGEWDEDALAKNRRVVLRILEPTVDGIPFPESLDRKLIPTVDAHGVLEAVAYGPQPLPAPAPAPGANPATRAPASAAIDPSPVGPYPYVAPSAVTVPASAPGKTRKSTTRR